MKWWPDLTEATKAWLIANNGDAIPAPVVDEIVAVGGATDIEPDGFGKIESDGVFLSDEATDWIEGVANGES